jgi:ATP-dependent helicase/nuclease subunit A
MDGRDRESRHHAVDPTQNVALQASAGTGKTRVLVDRYINLLRVGVDPSNILAITFTRKAAAEMRDRILATLRACAARGEVQPARWRDLRDRLGDIAISTIDAFCLSLLREFPLEADIDPGFRLADDVDVPRLVDESLDRALRVCRVIAQERAEVALVFARLGERRIRRGLAMLLARRLVAPELIARYLASGPSDTTIERVCARTSATVIDVLERVPGGLSEFLATGPIVPSFELLRRGLEGHPSTNQVSALLARVRDHFLTQDGQPRKQLAHAKADFATEREWRRHRDAVIGIAPAVADVLAAYRRDLNLVVSRGVSQMFQVALAEYRRTLDVYGVLDFSDVLVRALDLLRGMDEFAQSRYRLESRYHHILVDEFQDTSRAQWELISLLVRSWGDGAGAAHSGPVPPSIFIVGDPKQSIYGFRDADASILSEASRFLAGLRSQGDVRRSISRSFRSVPGVLAFVNDLCANIDKAPRSDAFRYDADDRFPIDAPSEPERPEVLGLIAAETPELCAARTAAEIGGLLRTSSVRDRETGLARPTRPADIAILFRTRESHREFEAALEARGIPSYVYKGLGFFDADEIKDVVALLWYLADPHSDRRAAAFLRSRIVGLSDDGLRRLAPRMADAITRPALPPEAASLDEQDARLLAHVRAGASAWLSLVDRLPPAEVLDRILAEAAYAFELRGPRLPQARENLKKIRALVRRLQNRGYLTMARLAAHIDRLSVGDEANAVIDAQDAVNLMTVHAAKGLEFPIVFVVNLSRGTGNWRDPIRVSSDGDGADAPAFVSIGDFQSEADDDSAPRDREETKRLLYVALTRARDRLYLSSLVKQGKVPAGRGSLGEVLPASFTSLFPSAALAVDHVLTWQPSSGASHRFCVCADGDEGTATAGTLQSPTVDAQASVDVAEAEETLRAPVASGRPAADGEWRTGAEADRIVGLLVHRLFERMGFDPPQARDLLLATARALLRRDDLAQLELAAQDIETTGDRAVDAYGVLCRRPDVRAILEGATTFREVPFTIASAGGLMRGTIDCLVRGSNGTMTVLEFKTGRPLAAHLDQLEVYRSAAVRLFPDLQVDARLIYAAS